MVHCKNTWQFLPKFCWKLFIQTAVPKHLSFFLQPPPSKHTPPVSAHEDNPQTGAILRTDSSWLTQIQPVNHKEINPEYSMEGLMLKLKLIFWAPDVKSQLIWKDPDAGRDWRREKKGMTENEMVGWHHWLKGQELEQTPGDSGGRGSLECCSPRGCKELDMIYWLNNNIMTYIL